MRTQSIWLWIGGVIAVAAVALALGMPLETLLILALILCCPLAMYFMMRMGGPHASDRAGMSRRDEISEPWHTPKDRERQATHSKYEERP